MCHAGGGSGGTWVALRPLLSQPRCQRRREDAERVLPRPRPYLEILGRCLSADESWHALGRERAPHTPLPAGRSVAPPGPHREWAPSQMSRPGSSFWPFPESWGWIPAWRWTLMGSVGVGSQSGPGHGSVGLGSHPDPGHGSIGVGSQPGPKLCPCPCPIGMCEE